MKNFSYLNLEQFENYVIKENKNFPFYYILSQNFNSINHSSLLLNKVSIFEKTERGTIKEDKNVINVILTILKKKEYSPVEKKQEIDNRLKIEIREKKSIGSMMGMAIGDAMGSTYEFQDVDYEKVDLFNMDKENEGAFNLEPGQWTDDCSMGLCIADSLLVNNGILDSHDLMHRFLAWCFGGYNNAFRFNEKNGLPSRSSIGLGGNISMALFRYLVKKEPETKAGNEKTSGNGSIMRNGAIPLCFYYDINLARKMAIKQSLTTHQGLEAKECCSLLTFIIVKILNDEKLTLKEILENLGKDFDTDIESVRSLVRSEPDTDWNWKEKDYRYNEERAKKQPGYIGSYAMDNMCMSLHIVYYTNSFQEAIIKAVNLRGDADSVASVVGQIAGAYYPLEDIPPDWIEKINKWDDGEIALRGYMLSRLYSKKSIYIDTIDNLKK